MTHIAPAIAGLGITEQGKVYGRTARQFAAQAVRLAAADAGLELSACATRPCRCAAGRRPIRAAPVSATTFSGSSAARPNPVRAH